MKITVTIEDYEVKGIKAYLKAVDGIEKPTAKDVKNEIIGIVSGALQYPNAAMTDYINKFRPQS